MGEGREAVPVDASFCLPFGFLADQRLQFRDGPFVGLDSRPVPCRTNLPALLVVPVELDGVVLQGVLPLAELPPELAESGQGGPSFQYGPDKRVELGCETGVSPSELSDS